MKSKSTISLGIENCLNRVHMVTYVSAQDSWLIKSVGMPGFPFKELPIVERLYAKTKSKQYPSRAERYALFIIEDMSAEQSNEVKAMVARKHKKSRYLKSLPHAPSLGLHRYGTSNQSINFWTSAAAVGEKFCLSSISFLHMVRKYRNKSKQDAVTSRSSTYPVGASTKKARVPVEFSGITRPIL